MGILVNHWLNGRFGQSLAQRGPKPFCVVVCGVIAFLRSCGLFLSECVILRTVLQRHCLIGFCAVPKHFGVTGRAKPFCVIFADSA